MLIGYAWNQELYGNQRNETFDDIFPSLDDFKTEYTECKLPLTEYFGDVSYYDMKKCAEDGTGIYAERKHAKYW